MSNTDPPTIPTPKDEQGVHSLHRYFLWSNRMRQHLGESSVEQGPIPTDDEKAIAAWLSAPLAYQFTWAIYLQALIEGWQELGLHDDAVNELLKSPHRDVLRRLRNGAAHFQRDYWHDKFVGFLKSPEAMMWMGHLHDAFEWYFRRWMIGTGVWVQPPGVDDGPLSHPGK